MDKARYYIPSEISDRVILVGEYFMEKGHGGISSVLAYYRPHFETFRFIASHRRNTFVDKIVYDLGGLLKLVAILLWEAVRSVFCGRKTKVVHIHTAAGGSFRNHCWYVRAARFFGCRVILHSHASGFKDYFAQAEGKQGSILRILNEVDRLVVLSRSWKEWFMSIGVSDEGGRIVVLNNIVPIPEESYVVEKRLSDTLNLLFLGEIGKRKGVFDLVKAVSDHRNELEGRIELRIGGNGETSRLASTIESEKLSGMVAFEGFVSGDKKRELLSWADVLVLPSFNEGLPISILEGMSYGNAVLSTPVGGIPEVVDSGNGVLVQPGDSEGIFKAVEYLLSLDREHFLGLCEESRRRVEDFYPEKVLTSLLEIYRSLV